MLPASPVTVETISGQDHRYTCSGRGGDGPPNTGRALLRNSYVTLQSSIELSDCAGWGMWLSMPCRVWSRIPPPPHRTSWDWDWVPLQGLAPNCCCHLIVIGSGPPVDAQARQAWLDMCRYNVDSSLA